MRIFLVLLARTDSITAKKQNPDVPPQSTDQAPQTWGLSKLGSPS